jgi:hypothetical protein
MMDTIATLLAKWKDNKWEYTIYGAPTGEVKVTVGVFPPKHTQPKMSVGIGLDELDAMVLADHRAEEVLREWSKFEEEIRAMGARKFP